MAIQSRRNFLLDSGKTVGAMTLAGVLSKVNAKSQKATRPNFIFAMTDDHGWDGVGFTGANDVVKTPHLNQMAKEGVYFSRFYTAYSQCSPCRAGILTGRNAKRFNQQGLRGFTEKELTIAEILKEAGYATGVFGKWHMGGPGDRPNKVQHGFDEAFVTHNFTSVVDPKYYGKVVKGDDNEIIMSKALDFIKRSSEQGKTVFLLHPVSCRTRRS